MIDLIGWIGNLLLASCGIPLLIDAIISKGKRISLPFMYYWLLGEIGAIIFVLYEAPELPLIVNYGFNILLISIIIYISMKGKNNE